ncbi:MAG: hypothetical protein Q4G03_04010 [Planctomycetia bacterium]|nr:hypothetical protein [Planctomycetia bacterium]
MTTLEEKETKNPVRSFALWLLSWRAISFLILVVLATASSLKTKQLASQLLWSDNWLDSRFLATVAAYFEATFAIWLLFGFLPRITRLASAALFLLFSSISFYKGISGASSCGCFGEVEVNPWVTFGIDVVLLVLCVVARVPKKPHDSFDTLRQLALPYLLLTSAILVSMTLTIMAGRASSPQNALVDERQNLSSGSAILLDANLWLGRRCPIIRYCPLEKELESGTCLVMLGREDCRVCADKLPEIKEFALKRNEPLYKINLDAKEVFFSSEKHEDEDLTVGYLTPAAEWVGRTPQVFELKDGIVTNIFAFEKP